MANGLPVDVTALIDERKIGALQIRILLLGALAMIVDGFDLQVLGFAAPAAPWQGVFVFGSLLPFLLIPLMAWLLSESLQSLVQRNVPRERLARLAARLQLIPAGAEPAAFVTRR